MAYADTDRLKVRGWAENMWDEQGWESLANSAIALCDNHERLTEENARLRAALEDILEIHRRHPGDTPLRMVDRAREALKMVGA